MNNVNSLKPRQLSAIKLLAMGTPVYQVAERLEVSTMTLYRWQRQPEFESRLNALAYSGLEEITKQMNAASLTAVETLQQILCDMREPTAIRMKAALGVLNAMPAINSALEKGVRHKLADFDLKGRWNANNVSLDDNECFVQGVQEIGG